MIYDYSKSICEQVNSLFGKSPSHAFYVPSEPLKTIDHLRQEINEWHGNVLAF